MIAIAWTGLAAASLWSIRLGWGDYHVRQETVSATERAIAIVPENAEGYARLAWLVSEQDSQKAAQALHHAVALNPFDAPSWIELGLLAEGNGDEIAAVQYLQRATQVDHTFLPRWTLTNYYFRHNDPARFWFWAQQAAGMLHGDPLPFFKLCARMTEDGNLIHRLAIEDATVRAAYLSYLLGINRIDLTAPALHSVSQQNRAADFPLLLTSCDLLLEAGRVDEAADVWNRLAAAGRVPFRTPPSEAPQLLSNANFLSEPTSRGFDWRFLTVEGVTASREEESRGLRLAFSGSQPELCDVLTQLVPLAGRTAQYRLSFKYRTGGIGGPTGLEWRITDAANRAVFLSSAFPASDTGVEAQASLEVPPSLRLLRVTLRYRRPAGSTRIEGYLALENVALQPAPQPPIEGARVRK